MVREVIQSPTFRDRADIDAQAGNGFAQGRGIVPCVQVLPAALGFGNGDLGIRGWCVAPASGTKAPEVNERSDGDVERMIGLAPDLLREFDDFNEFNRDGDPVRASGGIEA